MLHGLFKVHYIYMYHALSDLQLTDTKKHMFDIFILLL